MGMKRLSWGDVYDRLRGAPPGKLFGVPRGGAVVAGLTGRAVDSIEDAERMANRSGLFTRRVIEANG